VNRIIVIFEIQISTKGDARMRTIIGGKNIAVAEFVAELTGEDLPWADSGTKAISLRIHESDVIRAEALAEFGHKKRAAILKAAVGFGLDAIIHSLSGENGEKFQGILMRLKREDAKVD
jgi:hypothetical protein